MTKVEIEIMYDNNETKYNIKSISYEHLSNANEIALAGSFYDMIKRILENMKHELNQE